MQVLLVIHAVRTVEEREITDLLARRLLERGDRLAALVWDRGMIDPALDLDAFGPSREIEAINRWRLPQWLAKVGLAPAARLTRNLRVRSWWRRLGRPDAVILIGPVREEMRHYLPPATPRVGVGALLGHRPLEPAESLATTLELTDVAVVADAATADACRDVDADVEVTTFAEVLDAATAATSTDEADQQHLVVGIGPGSWRGAPDLFLRVAAALRGRPGRSGACFGWIGLDPDDDRSFPYRFDATRLGLDAAVTWTDVPATGIDLLRRADVLVLTARADFPLPVHPWVSTLEPSRFLAATGTSVLAFDTPAASAIAGPDVVTALYPDTEALAAAVDAALDRPSPSAVPRLLDEILTTLGVRTVR